MKRFGRKQMLLRKTAGYLRGPSILLLCALLFFAGMRLTSRQSRAVSAMADQRELPVYCVQTDSPQIALSFDASWGNEETRHLLDILGISREEMVCCGDGFNDVSMIQFAGLGVAMANAQEKVKDVADYITVNDNDHDGIAEVIEKFF